MTAAESATGEIRNLGQTIYGCQMGDISQAIARILLLL